MPLIDNITIKLSCQQYESTAYELREDKSVIRFESTGKGSDAVCPYCKRAHCHIQSRQETRLKDMPVWFGTKQEADVAYHRYICLDCKRTFMEDIPLLAFTLYPLWFFSIAANTISGLPAGPYTVKNLRPVDGMLYSFE